MDLRGNNLKQLLLPLECMTYVSTSVSAPSVLIVEFRTGKDDVPSVGGPQARQWRGNLVLTLECPTVSSCDRLHAALIERSTSIRVARSCLRAETTSIHDALESVRDLRQQTKTLLDQLRWEMSSVVPASPSDGVVDAERELSSIRARREQRSTKIRGDGNAATTPRSRPTTIVSTRSRCRHCLKEIIDATHEDRCSKRQVRCRRCNQIMTAELFRDHRQQQCSTMPGTQPGIVSMASDDTLLEIPRSRRRSSASRDRSSIYELDVKPRCKYCGLVAPPSHLRVCALRPVKCSLCGEHVRAMDEQDHIDAHKKGFSRQR